MSIQVKIIADSVSGEGKRITTMQLKYQRFIHSEFKTHRILSSDSSNEVFVVEQSSGLMDDTNLSRNASSSRAIPVAKMIEQVRTDPAMPIHWGKNQPGMQAKEEIQHAYAGKDLWKVSARYAADVAEEMSKLGLHKQVVNRILEPYQWIHVVVTATEWDNFFELRYHEDAQPEIYELAKQMRYAMDTSEPVAMSSGDWHLPYVTEDEYVNLDIEDAKKVSAARCCRVSYLKHDGTNSTIEEDIALCNRLAGAKPIHASPFEHQATPDLFDGESYKRKELHGNFAGWIQHRKLIEESFN